MSSITQSGVNRVPTSSGTAVPSGGSLTLVGAGGITTSASGSTVTITGSGGGGVTSLTGNSGAALTGALNLVGAGILSVAGAGSTLTISMTNPVPIANGGTNATSFATTDGTVIFDGTRLVTLASTGTSGQALVSAGAGVAPAYGTLPIAGGGTNATSMTNTFGVNYYDGTSLVTTTVGTSGQVLTSNGAGVAPTFQAAGGGGGITTIDGDTGSATGSTVTFSSLAGESVTFSASGATVAFNATDSNENTLFGQLAGGGGFITTAAQNTAVGKSVLNDLTTGTTNTAVGYQAGINIADGYSNIAIGQNSMGGCISNHDNISIGSFSLLGATGNSNIAIGTSAMGGGTSTGNQNVVIGPSGAMQGATTAHDNVMIGYNAGNSLSTAFNSVAIGSGALAGNTTGNYNVAVGKGAMSGTNGSNNIAIGLSTYINDQGGSLNTVVGDEAMGNIAGGGMLNIALGANAGNAFTTSESGNIMIGALGVIGDNNTTRIGYVNSATTTQTACFIDGINGATVTGTAVLCSTDGQLGTVSSSIRYKDNVVDMADNNVMKLRPVNFTYKKSYVLQYGLIAEEVEEVFKDLVFYNAEGKPESVHYEKLPAILLHELQKQNKRIEVLEALLASK